MWGLRPQVGRRAEGCWITQHTGLTSARFGAYQEFLQRTQAIDMAQTRRCRRRSALCIRWSISGRLLYPKEPSLTM